MAASIEWTDDDGFASLANGYEAPVGRFMGWESLTDPIGPGRNTLASGTLHMFEFRADYGAKFMLRELPDTATTQTLLLRLKRHLKRGSPNTITVNTGDDSSRSYTCTLWPGADVTTAYDAKYRKRSVTLSVLNTEAADMVCQYP